MNIVLVRVDDRLIHGQILESWIPSLKAECVVVAHDSLAQDPFQRAIFSMAVPERIKLRIVPVEACTDLDSDPELSGRSTLIIVASVADAFRLYAGGMAYARLNLGNMKAGGEAVQISYSLWIGRDDVRMLKDLIAAGLSVTLQSVPREREIDMRTIIDTVKA